MAKLQRVAHAAIECGITLRHSENAEVRESAVRAIREGIAAIRNPNDPSTSMRAFAAADEAMQTWLQIPRHDSLPEIVVESGVYPIVNEGGGNEK